MNRFVFSLAYTNHVTPPPTQPQPTMILPTLFVAIYITACLVNESYPLPLHSVITVIKKYLDNETS